MAVSPGTVTGVTSATNTGYVGTGTDTGHNSSITNPIPNPNAPPATVEVPPSESWRRVWSESRRDRQLRPDHGLRLAWSTSCQSVGPAHREDLLRAEARARTTTSGAPTAAVKAMKWRSDSASISTASWRFHPPFTGIAGGSRAAGEIMSPVRNSARTDSTRSSSRTSTKEHWRRAIGIDGIVDGMIQETRKCTYDARQAVCGQPALPPIRRDASRTAEAGGREQDLGRSAQPGRHQDVGGLGTRDARRLRHHPGRDRRAHAVRRADQSLLGSPGSHSSTGGSISEEQFLVEQRNLTKQFSQYIGSDSTEPEYLQGKRRQADRQLRQSGPDHSAEWSLQLHAATCLPRWAALPKRRSSIATTSFRTPRIAGARA